MPIEAQGLVARLHMAEPVVFAGCYQPVRPPGAGQWLEPTCMIANAPLQPGKCAPAMAAAAAQHVAASTQGAVLLLARMSSECSLNSGSHSVVVYCSPPCKTKRHITLSQLPSRRSAQAHYERPVWPQLNIRSAGELQEVAHMPQVAPCSVQTVTLPANASVTCTRIRWALPKRLAHGLACTITCGTRSILPLQ